MNFNKWKKVKKSSDLILTNTKKRIKPLKIKIKKSTGRNKKGLITVRHKGGGCKKMYRRLWSMPNSNNEIIYSKQLETYYDPYRTAYISLSALSTGHLVYTLAEKGLNLNSIKVFSKEPSNINNENYNLKIGNRYPLKYLPIGSYIYDIKQNTYRQGQFAKSAGSSAKILKKYDNIIEIKMPSGQIKAIDKNSEGTLGQSSNSLKKFSKNWKAGTSRKRNKRPTVRGVAMNPVDHPHGGGEGKSSGGRPSVSPWGKLTKVKNKKRKNAKI